jgi:hypothetical protein
MIKIPNFGLFVSFVVIKFGCTDQMIHIKAGRRKKHRRPAGFGCPL